MQNLVLPFSLALRAACSTGSTSNSAEAFVRVEYRDDWEQYLPAVPQINGLVNTN
jgi:hypothetical protein